MPAKNIITIVTDTFRYDNLGARAKRPVRTPALDRFVTERAAEVHGFYIGSFPTIPMRTDFATGTCGWPHYPWQHIEKSGPNHVASILKKAGYVTQMIVDCPHLFKAGFNLAFDGSFQHRGQEGDKPLLHLNHPIQTVQPNEKSRAVPVFNGQTLPNLHRWTNRYYECEADTFCARTAATSCRWLEENYKAGPFYLWVDLFDPHEPWDPPEYLVKRYDPDYDGPPMLHPNYGPSSIYAEAELKNLWAHYAAESELVDRHIGRILEKLDDLELWDDTVVAVLSDHGMAVGEHGGCGKSNLCEKDPRYWPLYPELSHAMLAIAGPDVPRGQGRKILAQPMDVLPTLAELAGANVEPPKPFDGKSFAGALREGGAHREIVVSGCHRSGDGDGIPRRSSTPFAVTDKWGYAPVGQYGDPELYAIDKDPLATKNVAKENPAAVQEMHTRFLDYLKQHKAPERCVKGFLDKPDPNARGKWSIDYPNKEV